MAKLRSAQANLVGLIPAGGYATRLGTLPCSKEVLPIDELAIGSSNSDWAEGPLVCSHLLRAYRRAGVDTVYCILRDGKWDIPGNLKDGADYGLNIAYLIRKHPYGVPFTLAQALPFARDSVVALGFPDILFSPDDAFASLLGAFNEGSADAVLGVFPTDQPAHVDTVALRSDDRVTGIEIKNPRSTLCYAWILAVWSREFSVYLQSCVEGVLPQFRTGERENEIHLGEIFQMAIEAGMKVRAVRFDGGEFVDIGHSRRQLVGGEQK